MKTVHKYGIGEVSNSVQMPKGARILHVGGQGDEVCIWASVDTERLKELRHFRIYGTGQEFPDDFEEDDPYRAKYGDRYIGTAFCGRFVWHVFERLA